MTGDRITDMDAFTSDLDAATKSGKIPGVVLAAVDKAGSQIYSHASGPASVAPGAATIKPDSTFVLGSCTKIVTAIACMQCVERCLITLDEPLDSIMPELAKLQLIVPVPGSMTDYTLGPVKNKITLRQLITHTSGITYDLMSPHLQAWQTANRGQPILSFAGKLFGALDVPLVFEPGTAWLYGAGFDWAGEVVARLTKMRFAEYCEQNIFQPLGMKSSTFHLETRPDVREKLVTMSTRNDSGQLTIGGHGLVDPAEDDLGGIGLYSSVPDYLKLFLDMLQDQPKTLKSETMDMMFTPQLEEGGAPLAAMKELAPLLWRFYMSDLEPRVNHGLGALLCIADNETSGTPKGTLRWSGYSGPIWAVNREKGLAWFYATQIVPFGDVETGKRAEAFGKLIFSRCAK